MRGLEHGFLQPWGHLPRGYVGAMSQAFPDQRHPALVRPDWDGRRTIGYRPYRGDQGQIVETGRFSLPDFGSFTMRETPKRMAPNPKTGDKVAMKAAAIVRFKVAPSLKEAALAGMKKARRKGAKAA